MKPPIKLNQIWKSKVHAMRVIICGRKGGKWKAKVMTDKHDVFNGSHTLSETTLWKRYELQ